MMFFGREEQLGNLEALCGKRVASLVTCRGRRRIGKSTLIAEFARRINARFIHLEGVKPRPGYDNSTELDSFSEQLAAQVRRRVKKFSNWTEAFVRLDAAVSDDHWTVILLDEISWFGLTKSHGSPISTIRSLTNSRLRGTTSSRSTTGLSSCCAGAFRVGFATISWIMALFLDDVRLTS